MLSIFTHFLSRRELLLSSPVRTPESACARDRVAVFLPVQNFSLGVGGQHCSRQQISAARRTNIGKKLAVSAQPQRGWMGGSRKTFIRIFRRILYFSAGFCEILRSPSGEKFPPRSLIFCAVLARTVRPRPGVYQRNKAGSVLAPRPRC